MGQGKINAFQLFCLMVLFELGSAVVVGVGLKAKQDAWMAILLGMSGGIPLFVMYHQLFKAFPDLPLTAYIPKIVGKWVGIPLSLVYIGYFLYISSRVLRDFGELLITATLTETPLWAVTGLMMLLIAYGVFRGIEVIGRTAEPVFMAMISFVLFGILFLFISDQVQGSRLLPILENGWKPVLTTVLSQTYTFPFGELIVFTMLLPLLNQPRLGLRTGLHAILVSGLVLSATIACDIAVLGAKNAARSQFPLLETFIKVSVGDFIQRLDILVISTLILGMFIKIMVFFYAGVEGVVRLLKLTKREYRLYAILILGAAVLIYAQYMAVSFAEHIEIGLKKVPIRMHWPIQTIIPFLLFVTWKLRKQLGK